MPLIILSGYPCSGKSHRAEQLRAFFQARIDAATAAFSAAAQQAESAESATSTTEHDSVKRLTVHVVSDESLGLPPSVYADVKREEKDARAAEMSEIKKLISKDAVVISDGMNYIKGYRYQLYCEAKAVHTPSCVIHCGTPEEICYAHNNGRLREADPRAYEPDVFTNLIYRYEEPNAMTRWDSPLFTVLFDDEEPQCEAVWEAVIGSAGQAKNKTVRPNQATVLKPATQQNYLHELDRGTSEIVARILEWQKDHMGENGGSLVVEGVESTLDLPTKALTLAQLQRLRRQFITLNRPHTLEKARIKILFVDFLNDTFRR